MDKKLFLFILSNQQKWAQEYKEQNHNANIEKNKKCLTSGWYAKSKEYKRLWNKSGAQGFNK